MVLANPTYVAADYPLCKSFVNPFVGYFQARGMSVRRVIVGNRYEHHFHFNSSSPDTHACTHSNTQVHKHNSTHARTKQAR